MPHKQHAFRIHTGCEMKIIHLYKQREREEDEKQQEVHMLQIKNTNLNVFSVLKGSKKIYFLKNIICLLFFFFFCYSSSVCVCEQNKT